MIPLTAELRRVPIAFGIADFAEFAERSTKEAREVVRERIAALQALQDSRAAERVRPTIADYVEPFS
jgi:hypothetical protein